MGIICLFIAFSNCKTPVCNCGRIESLIIAQDRSIPLARIEDDPSKSTKNSFLKINLDILFNELILHLSPIFLLSIEFMSGKYLVYESSFILIRFFASFLGVPLPALVNHAVGQVRLCRTRPSARCGAPVVPPFLTILHTKV